jgi:hypothetical protein
MIGFAYRLKNTHAGSDRYGNCERCGKQADTMYILTQSRRYTRHDGTEGVTYHGCFQLFGHKECLTNLTNEVQNVSS